MPLWLLIAILNAGGAEDPAKPDEKTVALRLESRFEQQAKAYHFTLDADESRPLVLHDRPLMKWTADGNYGAVWIWTERGRPQLVGCIGAFVNGQDQLEGFHEFQSLTKKPMPPIAIGTDYMWQATESSPVPTVFPSAPAPADTHRARLLQMRQLAREFSVEMTSGARKDQLRLSPRPLFEFEATDGESRDGALFSFLWDRGTDPEALLLIESRQSAQGDRWYFTPIRFSWRELTMRHGDVIVWQEGEQTESRTARLLRKAYVSCPVGLIDLGPDTGAANDVKR